MSFDIWPSCFQDRKMAGFPRKIVEDAFGRFANDSAFDQWQLKFDDGGEGSLFVHLLGEASDQVTALTINRPASPVFWTALI